MKFLNVSDIHLDIKRPICRTDIDWVQSQQELIDYIISVAVFEKVDYIIDNGDTFDVATQPTKIVDIIPTALEKHGYPVPWICMPGNHSLPYHQMKNLPGSALQSLGFMKGVTLLTNCSDEFEGSFAGIPIVHRLIFPDLDAVPWYIKDKGTFEHAGILLEKFPHHDLILTGDYHHSFHFEKNGRHVVNPGCMNIQDVKMIGYQPKFAIIEYEPNTIFNIKWVDIPDQITKTTNEHITKVVESEEGINAILATLENPEKLTMKFWDDMQNYLEKSNIKQELKEYIMNKIRPRAL